MVVNWERTSEQSSHQIMQTNICFQIAEFTLDQKNAEGQKHPGTLLLSNLHHWTISTSSLKMVRKDAKYKYESEF